MSALSHTAPLADLAHFRARCQRDERRGEGKKLVRAHAPAEVNAVDDIAPLVGAAHLQIAAIASRQFRIVIGLQNHVVELDERKLVFALQTQFDRIHGQHAVDRKVPANVAQHVEIIQFRQPLRIVDHQCVFWSGTKAQELGENLLDAALVLFDILNGEQFAAFIAP